MALNAYNVRDDDWTEIKRVLALHFADKRDVGTLEYELTQMTQGNQKVEDFYLRINNHVSLIMNKIKSMNNSTEITNAFLAGQRDKALNAFIRGLNGDASRLLIISKPADVHEAYSICLELQKMEPRNPTSRAPLFRQTFNRTYQNYRPPNPPRFPQTHQFNNRALTSSVHNFAPSGSVQGSPRFQGASPAIKQESN